MARRRVVTGIDAYGKSIVVHDGFTSIHSASRASVIDVIWASESLPPTLAGSSDPTTTHHLDREPPSGGLVWRLVEFPPHPDGDMPEAGDDLDAAAWHATQSLDFGVVLSGEITLQLDAGDVRLTAGDCLVQRGARHRWRNHGTQPCLISFTNVSAR